jgi:DNA-binding NarL/FixJ family response regulator
MDTCRLLIIDDHAMFRSGLAMILQGALENIAIHEAASLDEAMRAHAWEPAIVVLDIHLQGLNGLECIAILQRRWPQAAIVVLSSDAADASASTAMARGAACFVSKSESAANIIDIVRRVMRSEFARDAGPVKANRAPHLTPRQHQVLDLICQGLPNKTIGRRLDLSENTVRGHVQALLAFLEVSSRTKAVYEARRRGLVS